MKLAHLVAALALVSCGGQVEGGTGGNAAPLPVVTADDAGSCGPMGEGYNGSTPRLCTPCSNGMWHCPEYGSLVPCSASVGPCDTSAGACIYCDNGPGIGAGLLVFCRPITSPEAIHATCTP
jgi:hypothetical protein